MLLPYLISQKFIFLEFPLLIEFLLQHGLLLLLPLKLLVTDSLCLLLLTLLLLYLMTLPLITVLLLSHLLLILLTDLLQLHLVLDCLLYLSLLYLRQIVTCFCLIFSNWRISFSISVDLLLPPKVDCITVLVFYL